MCMYGRIRDLQFGLQKSVYNKVASRSTSLLVARLNQQQPHKGQKLNISTYLCTNPRLVAHLSLQHPKNAQKLNSRPVYCSRLYGKYLRCPLYFGYPLCTATNLLAQASNSFDFCSLWLPHSQAQGWFLIQGSKKRLKGFAYFFLLLIL